MNIYKVEQDINDAYDTYDSFVCIADNEQEARETHPGMFITHVSDNKWMGTFSGNGPNAGKEYETGGCEWVEFCDIDKIKVTLIGVANDDQEKGVICSSYNAG